MSAKRKWMIAIIALVIVVIGVLLFRVFQAEPIPAYRLQPQDVLASLTVTGEVEAEYKVAISSTLNERISEILVDEGTRVQPGQIVAILDRSELNARIREARGQVQEAQAALATIQQGTRAEEIQRLEATTREARSAIAQYQAAVTSARANLEEAQRDVDRLRALYNRRVISAQEFEQATTRFDVAQQELQSSQANLASARARLQQTQAQLQQARTGPLESEIEQARANVAAATGRLETAQAQRDEYVIRSSISGVVVERRQDPGEVAIPGQPILTIATTQAVELEAQVEEAEIPRVEVGNEVFVTLDAYPSVPLPGVVTEIGNQINPENGTLDVTIALDRSSPQLNRVTLLPGMTADINIITERLKNVVVVPISSVERYQGQTVVYRFRNYSLVREPVRIQRISSDYYRVLSGIKPGEWVALEADEALLEKRRVQPEPVSSSTLNSTGLQEIDQ